MDSTVNDPTVTPDDLQGLVGKHVEEMELFQATFESGLQDLYSSQRQEYREFVIKVYEEIVARSEADTGASEEKGKGAVEGEQHKALKFEALKTQPDRKPSQVLSGPGGKGVVVESPQVADIPNPEASSSSQAQEGRNEVVDVAIRKMARVPSTDLLVASGKQKPSSDISPRPTPPPSQPAPPAVEVEDVSQLLFFFFYCTRGWLMLKYSSLVGGVSA
jgi:hypothetical protein